MKDYYDILQVSPDADTTEIKKSFRRLATLYHPDKNPDPSAHYLFQEINEAYQIIGDNQQRQWYDLKRMYAVAEPVTVSYTPPVQPRRPPPAYKPRQRVHIDLRPYLVFARSISWICLIFCVLLVIDYLLPKPFSEEPVLGVRIMHQTGKIVVTTPHRVMTMSMTGNFTIDLSKYTPVSIYRTPLFGSVVKAELKGMEAPTENNIYGSLVFFPVLLFILSLLGVGIRNNTELIVNFGIASSIILIITLFLIFVVFRL